MKYLFGVIVGIVFFVGLFGAYSLKTTPSGGPALVSEADFGPGVETRHFSFDRLGFEVDLPASWVELDSSARKRVASERLVSEDFGYFENVENTLGELIVLSAIENTIPGERAATLTVLHVPLPYAADEDGVQEEIRAALNEMLKQRGPSMIEREIVQSATNGRLGGLRGAFARTRDHIRTKFGTRVMDLTVWIVAADAGFLAISVGAPQGNEVAKRTTEAILASFRG